MFFFGSKINTSTLSFCNNSHKLRIYTPGSALVTDVVERDRCTTSNTARALPIDRAILWLAFACFYSKTNGRRRHSMIYMRLYPCLFAFLFREIERAYQWHLCATGRIRAGDFACPEPGYHCRLAAALFFWQCHFWNEVSN